MADIEADRDEAVSTVAEKALTLEAEANEAYIVTHTQIVTRKAAERD